MVHYISPFNLSSAVVASWSSSKSGLSARLRSSLGGADDEMRQRFREFASIYRFSTVALSFAFTRTIRPLKPLNHLESPYGNQDINERPFSFLGYCLQDIIHLWELSCQCLTFGCYIFSWQAPLCEFGFPPHFSSPWGLANTEDVWLVRCPP